MKHKYHIHAHKVLQMIVMLFLLALLLYLLPSESQSSEGLDAANVTVQVSLANN
jgi:hypothetical protein